MANYRIRCEAVKVTTDTGVCPGSARTKVGETCVIGPRTPEPPGMCSRAFASLHPMALAMRFSEKMVCEKPPGQVEVTCPDGYVVYKLTRVKKE